MEYMNVTCQVVVTFIGRTMSQNFYFNCKFLKNDTCDNVHQFSMAYGILKTLLYYFLIGTEVCFAVTSAGDSEYLDGGVMNFLKMTERSQTLSVA